MGLISAPLASAPRARYGDAIAHVSSSGVSITGSITQGDPFVLIDGLPAARVGDAVICALHGPQVIVTGSPFILTNGQPASRIGDGTSCGAIIVTGALAVLIN